MKFKPFYIICIIIIGLFLASLYSSLFSEYKSGLDILKMRLEYESGIIYKIKTIFNTVRPSIFLLIPLTGLLFKNKIGWLLITQYFYFIAFNMFRVLLESEYEFEVLLFSVIVILVIGTIIYFLNNKILYANHFKIKQQQLLTLNNITLCVGLFFSILLFFIKYNYWIE